MKSYTDLEQSKKLAKILPLESADMYYEPSSGFRTEPSEAKFGDIKYAHPRSIRCWSLAALFNIMPQINDWITPHGHKNDKLSQFEPKICKIWEHSLIPSYKVTYGNGLSTDIYDNPIDACYEMILKLHELKRL